MTKDRIKRLRKALKLTQQGLADLMGVPQATVGRWEAGTNSPTGLYLRALEELEKKAKNKAGRK